MAGGDFVVQHINREHIQDADALARQRSDQKWGAGAMLHDAEARLLQTSTNSYAFRGGALTCPSPICLCV